MCSFGSNITLTSGIGISSNKTVLTIDGTYEGVEYEYTDQKKLGTSDGIYIRSASTSKVTVKNMNITGYNYYGVIYVPESSAYKDVEIEYSNITYVGPQISFNPVGLTRFVDSNITVKENYAAGNEVAECNRIEIGGTTTIVHNSTGNSGFWFRNANPSFTILRGAVVNYESTSRELFYGVNNLKLTVSKNAKFNVISNNGLAYGTNGTGESLIDEGATFTLTKTSYSGSYATWYSYGIITVNKGATLEILNTYSSITSSNYNIYFMGSQSGIVLSDPKKIVLYNTVANVITAQNSSTFNFSFNRINLFDVVVPINDNITKSTCPTYSWYKTSGLSQISGTFTSSKTTIVSNNYTDEEKAILPDLTNFNISNKKILSIGTFPFIVDSVTDEDEIMSGITTSLASILIEYDDVNVVVQADETGKFSYSYSGTLPIGTIITFNCKMYNDVIYYTKQIEIVYKGELVISSATKYIEFSPTAISKDPIICSRAVDLNVVVIDSRVNSSDWKLYAAIDHTMKSSDGDMLEDSLVFLDENGDVNVLSSTPTLVYSGKNNEGSTLTTTVNWSENKGILLQLLVPLKNNVEYSLEIIWTIEE